MMPTRKIKRIKSDMRECTGCGALIELEDPDHPFDENYTIKACTHTPIGMDKFPDCPCRVCLIKSMCKAKGQYMCELLISCREYHRRLHDWRPLYEARDPIP